MWALTDSIFRVVCILVIALVTFSLFAARKSAVPKTRVTAWYYYSLFVLLFLAWFLMLSDKWWMTWAYPQIHRWRADVRPGITAYESGDYHRALPTLTAATEMFPQACGIRARLADCYAKLENKEQCVEQYRQILAVDDTGKWAVQARKQLRSLNVMDSGVVHPACTPVMSYVAPPSTTGTGVCHLQFCQMITARTWICSAAWIVIILIIGSPQRYFGSGKIVPLQFVLGAIAMTVLLTVSSFYGVTYHEWDIVLNGWESWILTYELCLTSLLLVLVVFVAYRLPHTTFALLVFTLLLGLLVTVWNMHECLGSKIAVTVSRTATLSLAILGIRVFRGIGDLRESPVLATTTFTLLFSATCVAAPLAIHAFVFLGAMPLIATHYDMTIPQYFWETPTVQWALGCFGGGP